MKGLLILALAGSTSVGWAKRSVPTTFVRAAVFRGDIADVRVGNGEAAVTHPTRTGLPKRNTDPCTHLTDAGGATAASVWPLALSARATKPEAFISSMNSRK